MSLYNFDRHPRCCMHAAAKILKNLTPHCLRMPTNLPVLLQINQTMAFSPLGTVTILPYAPSLRAQKPMFSSSGTCPHPLYLRRLLPLELLLRAHPVRSTFAERASPPNVHFLDQPDRMSSAAYRMGPSSKLWWEYAKADRWWGGTISVTGPLALWLHGNSQTRRMEPPGRKKH